MKRALHALGLAALLLPGVALAADAARTFNAKCGSCHGEDGKGKTKEGQKMKVGDMTAADWQKELTDEKIKQAILDGVTREKGGVKQEMKAFKDKLSPEQVDALVKYVRGLKP
jgi:mono/diheme cytochrome c family protein